MCEDYEQLQIVARDRVIDLMFDHIELLKKSNDAEIKERKAGHERAWQAWQDETKKNQSENNKLGSKISKMKDLLKDIDIACRNLSPYARTGLQTSVQEIIKE